MFDESVSEIVPSVGGGRWLQNDRGKIILPNPEKWFGSAMTHLDTSMICPVGRPWIGVVMRIAGAQIPVGLDIQRNKERFSKAIRLGKENKVDHLLTPEGSLSGYQNGCATKKKKLEEALDEILEFQKGIGLHLGTMFREKLSDWDITDRNEIRHYDKLGELSVNNL